MKRGEMSTLESIINAAKAMAMQKEKTSAKNGSFESTRLQSISSENTSARFLPAMPEDQLPEASESEIEISDIQSLESDIKPETPAANVSTVQVKDSGQTETSEPAEDSAPAITSKIDEDIVSDIASSDAFHAASDTLHTVNVSEEPDTPEQNSSVPAAVQTPPEQTMSEQTASDSYTVKSVDREMSPAHKDKTDLQTVGIHFLEFAVAFLTLSKCQYQNSSNLKVSSLPFFALVALDSWAEEDYTMSELAEKLQITKQQLSKMINVLEEKGLVERIHDKTNRRRVYIRICDAGREMMDCLKCEMLEATLHGLRSYTQEELSDMDTCICRLTELMGKFNTDPQ